MAGRGIGTTGTGTGRGIAVFKDYYFKLAVDLKECIAVVSVA